MKHLVLPLKRDGRTLTVAMADPTQPGGPRGPQVHHALRHLPGDRRRVHAPQRDREATTKRRRSADGGAARATSTTDANGDIEVVEDEEEDVSAAALPGADGGRAGRQADQRDPHRRREARRVGHPLRVLRARAPRPLPHRRRAAGSHEAADEAQGGADLALQDHGAAQHRRAPRAAGRAHQAEDTATRSSTSACRRCRRCSARRSCSEFSTRAT